MTGCGQDSAGYKRRQPDQTLLYRLVQENWLSFEYGVRSDGGFIPAFVSGEFEAFIGCGILGKGFVNVRCSRCSETRQVAFSCKRRGFCPSCIGRRMAETAAQVTDNIFPATPARQWVLTVPHRLRYEMARDPRLTSRVLGVFVRQLSLWLKRRARKAGARGVLKSAGITVIQRFGSGLALNVHFHTVMVDGVFQVNVDGAPVFFAVPAPSNEDVARVVVQICQKVQTVLAVHRDGQMDDEDALLQIAGASVQSMVATGPRRGSAVMRLGNDPGLPWKDMILGRRCAMIDGFNLHANTSIGAHDREGLERLLRYICRPPLSEDRLSQLADGRVAVRLKRAWRDGTTHVAFTAEEFMEKLVALVPRPRAHQIRYHGLFAPAAADRARIVPAGKRWRGSCSGSPEGRINLGTVRRGEVGALAIGAIPWAELMKRVFAIDVLRCPRCAGRMKVQGAVIKRESVEKILNHKDLSMEIPRYRTARAPPSVMRNPDREAQFWGC